MISMTICMTACVEEYTGRVDTAILFSDTI